MRLFMYFTLVLRIYCLVRNETFDLITNFLKENNSKLCYFFVCWKNTEKVKMHKILLKEDLYLRIAFAAVNDSTISNIKDEGYERISFILDLSCQQSNVIINESYNKLRFVHNWLMISNLFMTLNDIKDLFKTVKLRMDTDIKLAVPKQNNEYSLYEIYYPGLKADIKINKIGVYASGNLNYFNKDVSFYKARKNMSGILIRTGNRVNYSFAAPEDYAEALRHRQHFTFGKFHFQLFLHLVYIHEFHYNTTIRPEWFGNSSSGIEAGLSQLLWENEIDISSAGGLLRAPRMHCYDYLLPYYQFRTSFFFKNPGKVTPGGEVLKPFSLTTWYCFLAATIVVSIAIKAAYWIERRFLTSCFNYSIFTSFVITISLFAQQGSAIVPNHVGGRIIFLTILILSIILYNYYTSALVSSLLNTKPTVLETIRELYESTLKVGTEYQPYTNTYIVQARANKWVQKLNSSKIFTSGHPNYYTPEEGLAKVKKGGFAYHTEITTAYPIISRTFEDDPICDLAQIEFIDPASVGFMVPKKSQYRQLFLVSLVKMQQSGIFKRERDVWVASKPKCLLSSRVLSVGINELFLVYMILVGVCWKDSDKVKLNKIMMKDSMDTRTTFLSVKEGSISKTITTGYSKTTYILDLTCELAFEVLKEGSENLKFTLTNSWLILAYSGMPLKDVKHIFDRLELRQDMDVKVAVPKNNETHYDIYQIYDPGLEVDYKFNKVGYFKNGRFSYTVKDETFFQSRRNMSGVLVRIGNVVNFTDDLLWKYRNVANYNEHGGLYGLYLYYLFQPFVQLLKFHYNVTINYPWFGYADNGTNGGLGKLLYDEIIDLQIAGGTVTVGRTPYYEPIVMPYLNIKTFFIYRSPGTKKPGVQVLKPLASEVWYCFLALSVTMGVMVKAVFWIENRFLDCNHIHNFLTSVTTMISVLTQQGSAVFPQRLGGRTLFLNTLIFSFWLYNYYTSGLVSSLLNSKPQMLNSFRDLYQSSLEVGMEDQAYTHLFVMHSKDRYLRQIYYKKVYGKHGSRDSNIFSAQEGLERVRRGGFAFHTMVYTAYPIISRTFDQEAICDLGEIDVMDLIGGMFLKKKSQYKELFTISFTKLWESGLSKRVHDHVIEKRPECRLSLLVTTVGPQELFLIYAIFLTGLYLAIIILLVEIVYHKSRKQHEHGRPTLMMHRRIEE